ncbi:CDIP1 protein, partial [Chloroceryle aenea]|nr:CDIP1 protein [Chloroceryle aenea]
MSNDAPPPYPGGPSEPMIEEKHGPPSAADGVTPVVGQPQGVPIPPPEFGPPPYEPPCVPPTRIWPLLPLKMFTCAPFSFPAGYYPPPGPHPPMGYYPAPGHYPSPGSHTATVLVPSGAATTVTVLQGEIFQGAPVQTVCPHCQQAITTKITYEIGLMSFLLGFFCCFVGCDLCCCLIPCLFDDFKDVTHTCPNCKAYIYTYKRMC